MVVATAAGMVVAMEAVTAIGADMLEDGPGMDT